MARRRGLWMVMAAALLVACSSDADNDGVGDASQDVAEDIGADAVADVAPDVEADAVAPDATPDAAEDIIGEIPDVTPAPDAEALYVEFCAFCHGEQGEGYVSDNANALANATFLETATDDFLRDAIVHGRPGTPMSAWSAEYGGPLDDAQIDAIVGYMRAWQTTPTLNVHDRVVEGSALRGETVYGVACAECHGEQGEGVTAISLNNPWFHATASDGFIRHAIDVGRPDTDMGAFGEILSDQQIDDLVTFIRTWERPVDSEPPPTYEPDLDRAIMNPDGAPAEFSLREGRFVPADDVKAAMDAGQAFVLVDARPTNDFLTSHITGAINLPFYDIGDYIEELPRDVWIVTYCGCPHAVSGQAADVLLDAGFTQVAVLDEGFYVWQERAYPVSEGLPE